jgi:predicted AAA+ superfamily ATPase
LAGEDTVNREFGALEEVRDNFPKYVLSFDEPDLNRNGIIHKNIVDFLLESFL